MELNFEYSLLQKKYDHALRMIKELEKTNAELNIEIKRLYACRNELQEVTAAANDPAINNLYSLAEWVSKIKAKKPK